MSSSPLLQEYDPSNESRYEIPTLREQLYKFFSFKAFHYSVLLLVALDVGCMFTGTTPQSLCKRSSPFAMELAPGVRKQTTQKVASLY